MTEPIMIDGVDVSKCEFLEQGMCIAERSCDGYTDWECNDIELKNCYYKQLKRKELECETRKYQEFLRNEINTHLEQKLALKTKQLEVAREALEKLKRFAECDLDYKYKFGSDCENCEGQETCKKYIAKQALQEIEGKE